MSEHALAQDLIRIDGRSYGHYRELRGRSYQLLGARLRFDHIQGDPFAGPSRLRLDIPPAVLNLPEWARNSRDSCRATADYLQRKFQSALAQFSNIKGSGKSGMLEISPTGQEVLERTGIVVGAEGTAIVRICVGLPAVGRRIRGHLAVDILDRSLPMVIQAVLEGIDIAGLRLHVHTVEDQVALRSQLHEHGLIAFLAEQSVLPRRTGVNSLPLQDALPLQVPDALAVNLKTPHAGELRGLGIQAGVTLIVGGGYHGKSTLLQTLALGIYDHCPGDGREQCVSSNELVAVRAENGRAVRGVCLTPFIRNLPLERETHSFDTDDASGSTSQAAAVIEALELGASGLLIDEDTAAANFMIRDARMRALVPEDREPIIPYIDRVRQLWEAHGVSSVLVAGGAGDYLDVADCVIQMDSYQPQDVTDRAREVAFANPLGEARPCAPDCWTVAAPRIPLPEGLDPRRGRRRERVRSVGTRSIEFGREEIDVSLLCQIVDPSQCRLIGDELLWIARFLCEGRRDLSEIMAALDERVKTDGLDQVAEPGFGDRAHVRTLEVAAALNRLRSLRVERG